MTPEEKIEYDKLQDRLAWLLSLLSSSSDRQLILLDRVEKNTIAQEKLAEALLLVRQRLTDLYDQNEERRHEVGHGLSKVQESLATISNDVADVEREITGAHRLKEPSQVSVVFKEFRALPTAMQVLLIITGLLLAASGWLAKALDKVL